MVIGIAIVWNANCLTNHFAIEYFISNELLLYITIIQTILVLISIAQLFIKIIILAVNIYNNHTASSVVVYYNCIKCLESSYSNNVKTKKIYDKSKRIRDNGWHLFTCTSKM